MVVCHCSRGALGGWHGLTMVRCKFLRYARPGEGHGALRSCAPSWTPEIMGPEIMGPEIMGPGIMGPGITVPGSRRAAGSRARPPAGRLLGLPKLLRCEKFRATPSMAVSNCNNRRDHVLSGGKQR